MQQPPEQPGYEIRPLEYPVPGGMAAQPPQMAAGGMDRETERLLAGVAHGAIAFGLFGLTLPVSLLITGVVWLYSRRSPYVRFHSDQAGCYQCSVLLINVLLVIILAVAGGFSIFRVFRGESTWAEVGLVLWGIALFVLWFLVTIGVGIVGVVMVLLGRPFKYPFIGDWFLKRNA
ncbi:MAG: DUF4870 domain-containing protein [Chloroflexota bacterium]|nr:DUF4870 domain-containing protein [Chloroflexota bacterium]